MGRIIGRLLAAGAESQSTSVQTVFRFLLGAALTFAGVGHLLWSRSEFRAQVPQWFPIDADAVVLASGVLEIAIGVALVVAVAHRVVVGIIAAAFFVAIFPGNIAQFVEGTNAFGLDSDRSRAIRLLFQPVLVIWALWSTGALGAISALRNPQES